MGCFLLHWSTVGSIEGRPVRPGGSLQVCSLRSSPGGICGNKLPEFCFPEVPSTEASALGSPAGPWPLLLPFPIHSPSSFSLAS